MASEDPLGESIETNSQPHHHQRALTVIATHLAHCDPRNPTHTVNGDFGTQYTLGLQTGEDSRFLKAIVTLKHWDAYSLEDSDGFARYNFNAIVSPFALADTYWPAFEKAVKVGGAQGVLYS